MLCQVGLPATSSWGWRRWPEPTHSSPGPGHPAYLESHIFNYLISLFLLSCLFC